MSLCMSAKPGIKKSAVTSGVVEIKMGQILPIYISGTSKVVRRLEYNSSKASIITSGIIPYTGLSLGINTLRLCSFCH